MENTHLFMYCVHHSGRRFIDLLIDRKVELDHERAQHNPNSNLIPNTIHTYGMENGRIPGVSTSRVLNHDYVE